MLVVLISLEQYKMLKEHADRLDQDDDHIERVLNAVSNFEAILATINYN